MNSGDVGEVEVLRPPPGVGTTEQTPVETSPVDRVVTRLATYANFTPKYLAAPSVSSWRILLQEISNSVSISNLTLTRPLSYFPRMLDSLSNSPLSPRYSYQSYTEME